MFRRSAHAPVAPSSGPVNGRDSAAPVTHRVRRRLLVGGCLAAGVGLLLTTLLLRDYFTTSGTDWLFWTRPGGRARTVTIVAVDQRSYRELLPRYGPLVRWPRTVYARALDELRLAGPRVVAFDIFFDDPRPEDSELVAAIRRAGNVVMPVEAQGPRDLAPAPGVAQAFDVFIRPPEAISRAAAGEGFVNIETDPDTVVRRLPLLLRAMGEEVPALALTTVARFVRRRAVIDGRSDGRFVYGAGRAIPLVDQGYMPINFLGPPSTSAVPGSVPMIPLVDVLNGTFDRDLVKDKIVLIGYAIRGSDEHSTPTNAAVRMSGVEIQASAIETILGERYLVPVRRETTVVVVFALATLGALLPSLFRPRLAVAGALGLLAVYVVVAAFLFDNGTILDLVFSPLAIILTSAAAFVYRVGFEEREQRRVRSAMARYLSPSVSHHVLEDPARLHLGGETREMTVLFCDLRGFTTLSHALDPHTLVRLINEHMTAMEGAVFKHDGTVDKFMGDAIMAFWNAPALQMDHARRACATALEMVAQLRTRVVDWIARGLPALELGIGINTGPMVVGNMGSRRRMAYTVMGDNVNVASRLEGLSKIYGTRIVVGAETRTATGDAFEYRFLDLVAVKGRPAPLAVYELLSPRPQLDTTTVEVLASYDRAIALYRERRWPEAARHFAELHARAPGDGPTALYASRSQALLKNPPPPDWDGVYVAETK